MAHTTPIWLQAGSYAARADRQIIDSLFSEGVINHFGGDLKVIPRAAGANFTITVQDGRGVVKGDDQANQGSYLIESTADDEDVVVSAAPGAGTRHDLVVAQVNDPNAGGAAGDDWEIVVIPGTPALPAVPDTALALAELLVSSSTVSITAAEIVDLRVQATIPSAPPLPIGAAVEWYTNVAPAGHELLDGGAISRTTYPVLFDLWGTSFGSGDGSTTFNKPDRRGRVGVGRNAGDVDFDTIGETGGSKSTLKRTDAGDSNLAVDTTAGTQNVAANDHKHSLMPFMVVNYIVRAG